MKHFAFRAALVAAGLIHTAGALAQSIPADIANRATALRDTALEENIAYDVVESLTMEVGPRPAGSAGDRAAVKWAVAKLTELGFSNVRTEPVDIPNWERGSLEVRLTAPYEQLLVAASLGGSPGTPEEGIEAPIVRVESLDELKALTRDDLEGRIAFVDHVMERHKTGRGYGVSSTIRGCAHLDAAERGALALVMRSAGTSHHRFAHTGGMLRGGSSAAIPGIALANADADILGYAAASGETVSVRLHSTARQLPATQTANVIGEVPGRGRLADQIVVLGAHLDSWDLGTGAIDDATGVGVIVAAAKMIMEHTDGPRRTLRVILYGAEEIGIYGAAQYAERHADEIDRFVLGLESDFGSGRIWRLRSRVADEALGIIDELHALIEPLGIERGDQKAGGGADVGQLRRLGMPVLDLNPDGTKYFDYHHTADDTLDKVDPADLSQHVAAYVTTAWVALNIDDDFGRLPVDTSTWGCPD